MSDDLQCNAADLTCKVELHEATRLTVYDDATGQPIVKGTLVKGNPTIGIGTLIAAPGGITKAEAEYLFNNRLQLAKQHAATLPYYAKLNPVRQAVIAEMVYQLGLHGVETFTAMRLALMRDDYDGAAAAMLDSRWAQQTRSRALELSMQMRAGA